MATRLTDMVVDEVSFVKRGANQESEVVLFKRDTGGCDHKNAGPDDEMCPDCKAPMAVSKGQPGQASVHMPDIAQGGKKKGKGDDEEDEGSPYVRPPASGVSSSPPTKQEDEKPKEPPAPPQEYEWGDEASEPEPEDEDEEKPMLKSDLPEVLQKHLEGDDAAEVTPEVLAAAVEAAQAEAVTTAVTEATAEVEVGKAAEEEGLPVEIAKADPEIQALWKSQQEQITEATEIAKAERDARLVREFTDVAKGYGNLSVQADEFGAVLKALHDASPDLYASVKGVLDAANEASANLFKSIGRSPVGETSGSSLSAIEKAAAVVRSENPDLTSEEAQDIAFQRDPGLYTQYLNETQGV